MQIHSTPTRAVQYVTAAIFTLIALSIILQDVIGPDMLARWQLQHTLAVGLIIGTTLAIEAVVTTWTDGRRTLSLGYSAVAMIGLCLIVFMSGGRQAEAQAERDRVALAHNARIADAKKRLDDAVTAKAAADAEASDKAAERHCVTHCKDLLLDGKKTAADEVNAARLAYDAMPPPMQVGSKEGAFWSDTLSPWVEKPIVEHIAPKALYLFLVAFAELGAALSWIAARPRQRRAEAAKPDTQAVAPPNTAAEQEAVQPEQSETAETGRLAPVQTEQLAPVPEATKPDTKRARKTARKAGKSRRPTSAEIRTAVMVRNATGKPFKSDTEAARHFGYSRSRYCEMKRQWKEEGALV